MKNDVLKSHRSAKNVFVSFFKTDYVKDKNTGHVNDSYPVLFFINIKKILFLANSYSIVAKG